MLEAWGQNVNKASHRISEGSDLTMNGRVSLTPQTTHHVCVFLVSWKHDSLALTNVKFVP